ncbi:receptor kinase 1 [Perilla frutescens var. hirtella]|nr:receptor kinase 1 [Perilla frutescens var. hirtella]
MSSLHAGTDSLLQGQVLTEQDHLNSANKIFRLEFLSRGSTNTKYLAIIYNADNLPVWIANRDAPLPYNALTLIIDLSDGLLKISHAGGATVVSNTTPVRGKNTTATILDNGNLLLRAMNPNGSVNRTLWQSFDYPTDTFLPGMKLGTNFKTGKKWSLTSWMDRATKLPRAGGSSFTLGGDPDDSRQLVMWRNGSVYWRSGVWENGYFNNTRFFGEDFGLTYVWSENESYLMYAGPDIGRPLQKFRVYSDGNVVFLAKGSRVYSFSACSDADNLQPLGCVVGHEKLPECAKVDHGLRGRRGFVDGSGFVYDQKELSLFDCRERCRQNCSCVAFTLVNESRMGCQIFDRVARFQPSEEDGRLVYFLEKRREGGGHGLLLQQSQGHYYFPSSSAILNENVLRVKVAYYLKPMMSNYFVCADPSRRESIKWRNRMNIIDGVAQGLLYLHKYSRLKVIHRDLKASNILLDENMNPKISDFGMARIFGKMEYEANTNRIVGTRGYMSPECINGVISDKSDVFSFGVLLLEIVSAKKNHGSYHSQRPLNLIGLAWEMWVEGRPIELVDSTLDESNNRIEVIRCINIGLLCVQDNAKDRPSMTDVINMLANKSWQLPQPKQPAFFIKTDSQEADNEEIIEEAGTNDMSISVIGAR